MKHEIEIEGLPEGWRAVAYRKALWGEWYSFEDGIVRRRECTGMQYPVLIVEQIKPRKIVLEETGEFRKAKPGEYYEHSAGIAIHNGYTDTSGEYRIWRVVEEVERSSTTFRERVVNDLKHNKIISEGE